MQNSFCGNNVDILHSATHAEKNPRRQIRPDVSHFHRLALRTKLSETPHTPFQPHNILHPAPQHLLLCGYGYLGQAVERAFHGHGWNITCLSLTGNEHSLACDLGDADAVARIAAAIDTPDAIVHCAASGHGGPDAYRHVYLSGALILSAQFPSVPLLFTSSTSVYAQTDGSIVTEESPARPDRETGRILLAAEHVAIEAGGTVARLAGIYGPARSVLLRKFLDGSAVMEDGGHRYINQIHRDDAAAAIYHLVASRHKGIFNVCDSQPMLQADCYAALASAFNMPVPTAGPRDPSRKRGWTNKRVSNTKLVATGWEPAYPRFLDIAHNMALTL